MSEKEVMKTLHQEKKNLRNHAKKEIKTLKKQKKDRYKWKKKQLRTESRLSIVLKTGIVGGVMAYDFVCIYPLVNLLNVITTEIVCVIITGVSVLLLDYFPALFGLHLRKYVDFKRDNIKDEARGHLASAIVFFVAWAVACLLLDWVRREAAIDLYYAEKQMSSIREIVDISQYTCTAGQVAWIRYSGISPILTSLLVFGVTFPRNLYQKKPSVIDCPGTSPEDKEIRRVMVKTELAIAEAESAAFEVALGAGSELKADEDRYSVCSDIVDYQEMGAKLRSDIPVMNNANDPDVVTGIMEMRSKQQERLSVMHDRAKDVILEPFGNELSPMIKHEAIDDQVKSAFKAEFQH